MLTRVSALLLALTAVSAQESIVLSDCETADRWRTVTVIDDAREGRHAVRYAVPAGQAASVNLDLKGLDLDFAAGGELRFWYRFSGTGRSTLMIKILAFPFADGMQATWSVAPERPADGEWHLGTVDLSSEYLRWGQTPDKTSRVIMFRTQADDGAKLTLDLDQVMIVPKLFDARLGPARIEGGQALAELAVANRAKRPLTFLATAAGDETRLTVPAGEAATHPLRVKLDAAWLAGAVPLETRELPIRIALEGEPLHVAELTMTVTKPLALPPRPRLLATAAELAALPARAEKLDWVKAALSGVRGNADRWLTREVVLPPRGGQWWHYYACKKDGATLQTVSPTQHKCPLCGEIYSGWPWDDVVLDRDHNNLARAIRDLGLSYRLSGEAKYRDQAREILLAYAERYTKYPLHDIRGQAKVGGGRVGPQTLDESTWLIPVAQGADLVWDDLSEADRRTIETGLLRPAAEVIRQQKLGIHNIQCWKNSAVGLVGLLLDDSELIADAVTSNHGFKAQMAQGVTGSGMWYEGAWGYHWYTVAACLPLVEAGARCGLRLYEYEANGASYRRLFEGPLDLAMPDGTLPAFNDSGQSSIRQGSLYEVALARYGEPRLALPLKGAKRAGLEAMLIGLEALPEVAADTVQSRNHEGAGYAILTQGSGEDATWLCLKYGPHGGGHGHPDKLNFVLAARRQVIAVDPGTARYGIPIQAEWYRTTLAHNTLTVDEVSQRPATGKCLTFGTGDGWAAALAEAGLIADGVVYRRAAVLLGPDLVLLIDFVESAGEHTYDLAYHNAGKWLQAPSGEPVSLPAKDGYKHLRDVVKVSGELPTVMVKDGLPVNLALASAQPVELWAGTGVGKNASDRVPCVVARTKGKTALVAWALHLAEGTPRLDLQPTAGGATVTVKLPGGERRVTVDLTTPTVTVER